MSAETLAAQVTQHTCYTIRCARCPLVLDDGDGATLHFASPEEADQRALDCDWQHADDGVICTDCVAKAECERNGHKWTPWRRSVINDDGWTRFCQHCGIRNQRTVDCPNCERLGDLCGGCLGYVFDPETPPERKS